MDMINAKPRFGLEGERLFDYLTSRYMDPVGRMKLPEGEWDLEKVAEFLRAGTPIEAAFISEVGVTRIRQLQDATRKQVHALNEENRGLRAEVDKVKRANTDFVAGTPPNPPNDKVEQANKDFMAQPLTPETPAVSVAPGQPGGEPAAVAEQTQPPAA